MDQKTSGGKFKGVRTEKLGIILSHSHKLKKHLTNIGKVLFLNLFILIFILLILISFLI